MVFIVSPHRVIVVVFGNSGCGVVYSRLPVRTVQCGAIATHTGHCQAPVNGHRLGGQDCAGDWLLHLKERK